MNLNLFYLVIQGIVLYVCRLCRIISEDTYYNKIIDIIKYNGVVFVKMAQIISSRNDNGGVPEILALKLRNMQDKCFYHLKDKLHQVQGLVYSDERPISAGSICNIYRVVYGGRPGVIKCTHDNIRAYIDDSIWTMEGLNTLYRLYSGFDVGKNINLADSRINILHQLDLIREAMYQSKMRAIFQPHDRIHVPEVYSFTNDYIIMEYVDGLKFNDFVALYPDRNMECICLLYSVVYTMIQGGCIHGDLHYGNFTYALRKGEVHMNILDFGIMLELKPEQLRLLQDTFNILESDKNRVRNCIAFVNTLDPTIQARMERIDFTNQMYTLDEVMELMKGVNIPMPLVSLFTTVQSFSTLIRGFSSPN